MGQLSGRLGRDGRQALQEGEGLGGIPVQELSARLGELVDDHPVGDAHHDVGGVTDHLDAVVELDGVQAKLESGARVADVGCGHGASTVLMAQAFPASTFAGFDSHAASIERAAEAAAAAGVSNRVSFQVASADAFAGQGYDLVTHFDCLHDMGDPLAAARRARAALPEDGTWMIVEPRAGDRIEENLNPLGRLFYGMSTLICTPNALSETGESALGGQAGEARVRSVAETAGFSRFRRASESPVYFVYEARP